MSALEEIGTKYAESVAIAFPIYRVCISFLAFLGILSVNHQTHLSIFETLLSINILTLADVKSFTFKNTILLHIILSFLAPLSASLLSAWIAKGLFYIVSKGGKLKDRATEATQNRKPKENLSFKEIREIIDTLNQSQEKYLSKLKKIQSISESLYGISIIFSVLFFWGNILDLLIAILALSLAISFTSKSVSYFLENCYGTALLISQIEGKPIPTLPERQ